MMSNNLAGRRWLPLDTSNTISNPEEYDKIDNLHLKLNKAAYYTDIDKKFYVFKKDKYNRVEFEIKPDFINLDFAAIIQRQSQTIEDLKIKSISCTFSPDWRLIVGLGNESIYETSITLHHIYGIPYIPGQAIKGVVRNWMINELFEGEENDALKDEGFCIIFGSPSESKAGEHKGSVIFFDAFPVSAPSIEPDVMNSHYAPYYSDPKPPADYHNPNPVYFLTV
jgi:CRISPR-associated protein Cmr6